MIASPLSTRERIIGPVRARVVMRLESVSRSAHGTWLEGR
jgi:hypothetical protein